MEQQNTKERELRELQRYGDIAEAVSPVLHEVGNLLNTMVLEASNLELQAPAQLRSGFQVIRRSARQLGSLLNQFADYRSRKSPRPYPVELNAIVREAASCLAGGRERLTLDLAVGPILVVGSTVQLQILIRLLLTNALQATAPSAGPVAIHTEQQAGQAQITVLDVGPALPEAGSGSALADVREGADVFELATCQAIVRHLHGHWEATNRAEGQGVITRVTLPCPCAPATP
jgi:signal transduction histidine kinase